MININELKNVIELKANIYSEKQLIKIFEKYDHTILKGKNRDVILGKRFLIKINTLLGVSNINQFNNELLKLNHISNLSYKPDCIMDQTIIKMEKPFWKYMLETFDGPVGALPTYLVFNYKKGIDENELIDYIQFMCESGISFITLHLSANIDLYNIARLQRFNPTTSKSGGLLIKDILLNKRENNLLALNFDKILKIFSKYNIVLGVGSVFRPSNIFEALDEVHLKEIELQGAYIKRAKEANVQVIIEGPGHISISKFKKYLQLIKSFKVPYMPLGPLLTDSTAGFDHVSSALGAFYSGILNGADIFTCMTREEHIGSVPSLHSIDESIKCFKTAAHIVNMSRFHIIENMDKIAINDRHKTKTCITIKNLFDDNKVSQTAACDRCSFECPLILNK